MATQPAADVASRSAAANRPPAGLPRTCPQPPNWRTSTEEVGEVAEAYCQLLYEQVLRSAY